MFLVLLFKLIMMLLWFIFLMVLVISLLILFLYLVIICVWLKSFMLWVFCLGVILILIFVLFMIGIILMNVLIVLLMCWSCIRKGKFGSFCLLVGRVLLLKGIYWKLVKWLNFWKFWGCYVGILLWRIKVGIYMKMWLFLKYWLKNSNCKAFFCCLFLFGICFGLMFVLNR